MSAERHTPHPFLVIVALVALPVLVFFGALDNSFQLDDMYRVVDNPGVEQLQPMGRHFLDPGTSASLPRLHQYRPLMPLTLSINYALAGHSVVGYHLGNLLVHLISILLLYRLVRELTGNGGLGSPWMAGAVALLWGVHPVSGVPVNYICARDLLLMQMFLLGSLLVYVRMRRRGESAAGWIATLGLMALSLLSKTNAVALPLVVLAYELCLGTRRPLAFATWKRVLPFAAVAAGFFVWTRVVLDFSDLDALANENTPFEYGLTQLAVHVGHYLRNVGWPLQMRPLPYIELVTSPFHPMALLGLAVVLGSLLLAWRLRRRAPVASFAILGYWLMFAPTSSLMPFRYLATDYRAYPSLGFLFLAVGVLITGVGKTAVNATRWPIALVVALLLWFGWASHRQNVVWQDELSLWSQSVKYGATANAHLNLGRAQIGAGNRAEARVQFQHALDLEPDFVLAWINFGWLDINDGHVDEGLRRVKQAVEFRPEWSDAWDWYGRSLSLAGRPEEAWVASRRALELEPGHKERLYYAAFHAQIAGHYIECLEIVDRLHARHHEYIKSRFVRAFSLHKLERWQEAADEYRLYLAQHPNDEQARLNLDMVLEELGG